MRRVYSLLDLGKILYNNWSKWVSTIAAGKKPKEIPAEKNSKMRLDCNKMLALPSKIKHPFGVNKLQKFEKIF